MVYKDLLKKTYQPLRQKQFIPPAPPQQTSHTHPGTTYAQIAKQTNSNPNTQDKDHITNLTNQPNQHLTDIHELKFMMKALFEQLGTMLNLLITVLNKLP
jgi:hypothetical protein